MTNHSDHSHDRASEQFGNEVRAVINRYMAEAGEMKVSEMIGTLDTLKLELQLLWLEQTDEPKKSDA